MLFAALSLLVAACSSAPDSPQSTAKVTSPPTPLGSPQVATPTAMLAPLAPTASPNASPSPSPGASPAALASPGAIGSPSASPVALVGPAAILVTPVADGALYGPRFRIVSEQSEAQYRARETFVSQAAPSDAVGKTKAIQGELQLESDGVLRGQITSMQIDLRTLTSDQARRDSFIRQNTLKTDQFPFAEFRSSETAGVILYRPGEEAVFHIPGLMTIKGVERPIVWEAHAKLNGDTITGTATARVKLTDFGLEPPRLAILSVDDEMTWQIDLVAERVP